MNTIARSFAPVFRALPGRLIWHLGILLALGSGLSGQAQAQSQWEPVPPEDLAAKDSAAAPGSDMELLFVRAVLAGETIQNHVRAKLYTQKGVERTWVLRIEHGSGAKISDLRARVVKPGGTTVELTRDDFREVELWRSGDNVGKRTTFAFPDLSPGDVIEYRWNRDASNIYWGTHRQFCQAEDVFTREYVLDVKRSDRDYAMVWANCPMAEPDPKGTKLVVRNQPPFVKEPYMPSEGDTRGSVTLLFVDPWRRQNRKGTQWPEVGSERAWGFDRESSPHKTVRARAEELTAEITDPQEAVARLYRFVQTEITNLDFDKSSEFEAARKKRSDVNEPQAPQRTLELRTGNAWDISLLFAALVRGKDLEVRLGLSSDSKEGADISPPTAWVMANRRCILVDFDGRPAFYTPGDPLVPCGMLSTQDEGALVHICDKREGRWARTPVAKPAATQVHQTGRFQLDGEGTLEGSVEIALTGHRAREARDTYRALSNDNALEKLRAQLVSRLAKAEPRELTWSNLEDNTQPFVLRYNVRVPGYGESSDSRIEIPYNFFTANAPAVFTSETRVHPIFFGFAEQTVDDVEVVLPEGYSLDGARAPANVGDESAVVHAFYKVGYRSKSRTLRYRREQVIGAEGVITLKPEVYPSLRVVFDFMRQSDLLKVALKADAE